LRQTFEDDQPGWVAIGEGAMVGISRDPDSVHEGKASLQFSYPLQRGGMVALGLINSPALAGMGKLSFWVKASESSALTLAVQERGGGLWLAIFHAPQDQWQKVELTTSDFFNGLDPNTANDPNGKLDWGNLEFVGLGDFGQFLVAIPDPTIAGIFGVQPGPRTLWIDDLSLGAEEALPLRDNSVSIDDFRTPQVRWIPFASNEATREEKDAAGKKVPGMSLSYTQGMGKWGGALRRVNSKDWGGATKLSLLAASDNAANIVLRLEEKGGGKYFVPLAVPGTGEPTRLDASLASFQAADDSRDDNGKLDLDQVQQIFVVDTAAFVPNAANAGNTLWLGDISLSK
jgi:hypothetical protein